MWILATCCYSICKYACARDGGRIAEGAKDELTEGSVERDGGGARRTAELSTGINK